MPRAKYTLAPKTRKPARESVSLKSLAEHLGLSKTAVSFVINRSPSAKSIPQSTQELIRRAARELNYRPNQLARSLRHKRSNTIEVVYLETSQEKPASLLTA